MTGFSKILWSDPMQFLLNLSLPNGEIEVCEITGVLKVLGAGLKCSLVGAGPYT